MANLRVERKHGSSNWWIWALIAAAVVLLFFALFGWWGRQNQQAGLYDAERREAVTYEGQAWIPAGNAVTFPEDQMVVVGQSEQGHTLYANRAQGYKEGGGAGQITPDTAPKSYDRIYVKTTDGQYVPLFQQSGLEQTPQQ